MADRPTLSEEDISQLARIIFAEAANHYQKAPDAMEGIGWTIMNRVVDREFPKTIQKVIEQPKQFQGTRNKLWEKSANPTELQGDDLNAYARALAVARGITSGQIADPTGGSTFFYSSKDGKPQDEWFKKKLANQELLRHEPGDRNFGEFTFAKKPFGRPKD